MWFVISVVILGLKIILEWFDIKECVFFNVGFEWIFIWVVGIVKKKKFLILFKFFGNMSNCLFIFSFIEKFV